MLLNGYSDWFAPSSAQLVLLRDNFAVFTSNGFGSGDYWSSTTVVPGNYNSYYKMAMMPGENPSAAASYNYLNARAIRSF